MLDIFDSILNKPIFKSMYYRMFKDEIVDSLKYPVEDMYIDVDLNLIEEAKTRCLLLNTNITIDYFTLTVNGDVIVDLNLLLKYAKEQHLKKLTIPEGITFLYFELGYVKYDGKIVFPSTLKVLSPLLMDNTDKNSFDYGSITMNYGEFCEFGVLDFSKCLELKCVLGDAFANIKAKDLILPESIETLYTNFSESNIENVYINSLCNFHFGLSSNMIIKDNRIKFYSSVYHDTPSCLKKDMIIVPGGKISGKVKGINKVYYSIEYENIQNALKELNELYKDNPERFIHELKEILICQLYSVSLTQIMNSKLKPYFYKLGLDKENSFIVTSFLLMELYCKYSTDKNQEENFKTVFSKLFDYSDDNSLKELYFYNFDKDIDEFPVRERNYNLKYKNSLFAYYVEE